MNILLTTIEICWNSLHYAKQGYNIFTHPKNLCLLDLKPSLSGPWSHLPIVTMGL